MNLEHLISRGTSENIDIGAIEIAQTDVLVSWQEQITATMTIADPCVVTMTAHGLSTADPISFATTDSLPTGIVAGTVYFVNVQDANTFHLYDTAANATSGGATGRIATSGSQAGTHTASIWGVDVLDVNNKTVTAYVTTKAINVVRNEGKSLTCYAGYRSLPDNTSIKFYQKANWADSWTEIVTRVDLGKNIVQTEDFTPIANVIQIKCELNSSVNAAPEIDVIELAFN